jgi:predicted GIY-YIG superfamily endonuclease
MYYVYILKDTKTGNLYYGYTNNISRRIAEHNKIQTWELIYYEAYKSEPDACNRERQLRNYAQALVDLKIRFKESNSGCGVKFSQITYVGE